MPCRSGLPNQSHCCHQGWNPRGSVTSKKERIKKQIYKNRELALNDVADYISRFYNRIRRHRHLGGMSPEQFESAQKPR